MTKKKKKVSKKKKVEKTKKHITKKKAMEKKANYDTIVNMIGCMEDFLDEIVTHEVLETLDKDGLSAVFSALYGAQTSLLAIVDELQETQDNGVLYKMSESGIDKLNRIKISS